MAKLAAPAGSLGLTRTRASSAMAPSWFTISGLMSSSATSGTSASSCDTAISVATTLSMSAGGTSR